MRIATFRLPQLKQKSLCGSRQTNRVWPRAQQLKQGSPSGSTALSTGTGRRCPNRTPRDGQFRRSGYPPEFGVHRGCSVPSRVKTDPRGWSSRMSTSGSGRSMVVRAGGAALSSAGGGAGPTSIVSAGSAAASIDGGGASSSSLSILRGLKRCLRPLALGHSENRTKWLGDGSSSSHSATPSEKDSIAKIGSCLNASSHLACSTTNHGWRSSLDPPFWTPGSYDDGRGGVVLCAALQWRRLASAE